MSEFTSLNLEDETGNYQDKGNWEILYNILHRRFTEPFSSVIFIFIFWGIVFLIGGLGTWIPLFFAEETGGKFTLLIANSLATYFIALLATVFADLSFALFEKLQNAKSSTQNNEKISGEISLWVFTLVTSLIVGLIGVVTLFKKTNENWILVFSVIGTIISLFLWWIVNYDNQKLKESTFDRHYNPQSVVESTLAGKGVENGTPEF